MTENKKILKKPYSSLEYAEFAIYCNQNNLVITDFENKLIGVKQEISFTFLKNTKIEQLRKNIEDIFYFYFPQYRQTNIAIFGTEKEKEDFKNFHDKLVKIYDEKVKEINNAETTEEVEKIDIKIEF